MTHWQKRNVSDFVFMDAYHACDKKKSSMITVALGNKINFCLSNENIKENNEKKVKN